MAKRSNGEGTKAKYDPKAGRWYRQMMDGFKPDGKRNIVNFYGATEKDVSAKVKKFIADKQRGEYVKNDSLTMSELFDEWFKNGETIRNWRENTKKAHYSSITIHLKPAFGRVKVQALQPRQIATFIRSLTEKNYKSGSIHKILEPLQSALRYAVNRDIIMRSPMGKVEKPPKKQAEIKFLTLEEQGKLLKHLPDTVGGRAARFVLYTGLREGEVCGLRWGDLTDDGKRVMVNRSIRYHKRVVNGKREDRQTLVIDPPKTDAGERGVWLRAKALDVMHEQRIKQAKHRLTMVDAWHGERPSSPECYMFASMTGTALDPHNLNRTLRKALKSAGLEHRGMHALRHSFATDAINAGMHPQDLSKIIGHEKVSTTMNTYVHSSSESQRQGMALMDGLI